MTQTAARPKRVLERLLTQSGRSLIAVALFSALINLLTLTGPIFMMQVYDRVLGGRSASTLIALFGITAYLFVMMGFLDFVRGRILGLIGARLQERLEIEALNASLPDAARGRAAGTGLQDLSALQTLFASPALGAAFDLPWVPIFLGFLFVLHPSLGWFALACGGVVLALAAINQVTTRSHLGRAIGLNNNADRLARIMHEEVETVRALGMRQTLDARWKTMRDTALEARMAAALRAGGTASATRALRLLMQSAVLALGAWLVLQDDLTAGAMIAASILLGRTLAPLEQTVGQWPLFQRAAIGLRALDRQLTSVPASAMPLPLPPPRARFSAENVAYAPPGAAPLMRGLSFRAEAGDVIAVIGPSASGKTTLARLLTGVLPPSHGDLRLDGATLDQYAPDTLGRLLGYLPQRITLFAGTIAQNIARFIPDAPAEAIVAAAQAAGAHELILSLPNGYDTEIDDYAAQLSGGQRQRIGLARAFYGDPVLMVLDEPNSNLDDAGLRSLNAAVLAARAAGKIVFIMSHRPSVLSVTNKVMMIEAGQMRAFGPRDEILGRFVANAAKVAPLRETRQEVGT